MDIKCPHCGTEYEVEKYDMYRHTKCEVCGKGFVVGVENGNVDRGFPRNIRPSMVHDATFKDGTKYQSVWRNPSLAFTQWSFDGRALRSEYWPTILILGTVFGLSLLPFVWTIFGVIDSYIGFVISIILAVAVGSFCLFAQLPVTVRRLHDINLSGWWLLLFRLGEAIPYIGIFVSIAEIIIVGCWDGTPGENKYGSDPKGRKSFVPRSQVNGFASRKAVSNQAVEEPPNSSAIDIGGKLKKLVELRNQGLLTDEEYMAKKGQILKDF